MNHFLLFFSMVLLVSNPLLSQDDYLIEEQLKYADELVDKGGEDDYSEAFIIYSRYKHHDKFSTTNMLNLGEIYDENDNYPEALVWYKKAANLGNPVAMYYAGMLFDDTYSDADFVDDNNALFWYKSGAKFGHIRSMNELAYFGGYLISCEEAFSWLEKASELGDIEASNYLGDIYTRKELRACGPYPGPDSWSAIIWYKKAAELENAYAMRRLGYVYEDWIKDFPKALFWYTNGCNQGDSNSCFRKEAMEKYLKK